MKPSEALLRVARSTAIAIVIALIVVGLVSVGEAIHASIASGSTQATALDPPALRAEEAGLWVFVTLLPALFLAPLPERFSRTASVVRSLAGTTTIAILTFTLASMSARSDAANGLLLTVPPAFAGLMLVSWPFPRSGSDRGLGRWQELLAVPTISYLWAVGAIVGLRASPVDWSHDGLWLIIFGPVAAYVLLWAAAWWVENRGSHRSTDPSGKRT